MPKSQSHARNAQTRPGLSLAGRWLGVCLVLAGVCFGLKGLLPNDSAAALPVAAKRAITKPIADIRVGEWVVARNPQVTDEERRLEHAVDRVVPADWRTVSLTMAKADGHRLDITLLRPTAWLEENRVASGETIQLNLPEMDASGPAKVVSIGPCPAVEPRPTEHHRLVTATFAHSSADVLDISVEGQATPIGVTAAHLFWSADRHEFVPASELRAGEHLRASSGELWRIASVLPRGASQPVYNLEVEGEHVYYVSSQHLLVHNNSMVTAQEAPTGNQSPRLSPEPPEGVSPVEGVSTTAKATSPTGDVYSVAYQMKLKATSYPGFSRGAHFQEANGSLLQMMEGDQQFAQSMQNLGISLQRTPTGLAPRASPPGWTWHHAQEPGVMQLVPRLQHARGSIFQGILHPGGEGGYSIWGAP